MHVPGDHQICQVLDRAHGAYYFSDSDFNRTEQQGRLMRSQSVRALVRNVSVCVVWHRTADP